MTVFLLILGPEEWAIKQEKSKTASECNLQRTVFAQAGKSYYCCAFSSQVFSHSAAFWKANTGCSPCLFHVARIQSAIFTVAKIIPFWSTSNSSEAVFTLTHSDSLATGVTIIKNPASRGDALPCDRIGIFEQILRNVDCKWERERERAITRTHTCCGLWFLLAFASKEVGYAWLPWQCWWVQLSFFFHLLSFTLFSVPFSLCGLFPPAVHSSQFFLAVWFISSSYLIPVDCLPTIYHLPSSFYCPQIVPPLTHTLTLSGKRTAACDLPLCVLHGSWTA